MLKTHDYSTVTSHGHVQPHMHSSTLQRLTQEVIRILSRIDAEHNLRIHELECSAADEKLKEYTKQKLRALHRERREPHVNRLEEIRRQTHCNG